MADFGKWLRRMEGTLLHLYFRSVVATARYTIIGEENLQAALEDSRPILWGCWHGLNMAFMQYGARHFDPAQFTVIIVGDERGEVLAELGRRIGSEPTAVDMEGNPVASGRAVLTLIKKMRKGQQTLICPDGPDGPAFSTKDGIFFLAQKAQANIIPWGCWTTQAYVRKRWDHFLVPLPYARITVVIGKPHSGEQKR